jgi:hypothetical protein
MAAPSKKTADWIAYVTDWPPGGFGSAGSGFTEWLETEEQVKAELTSLKEACPYTSPDWIGTFDALAKDTVSSRKKSLSHLKELYTLSPENALFVALRRLHRVSPTSLPQIAVLIAMARDPLLRASAEAVHRLAEGASVTPADISKVIERDFPGNYSPKSNTRRLRSRPLPRRGHRPPRTVDLRNPVVSSH